MPANSGGADIEDLFKEPAAERPESHAVAIVYHPDGSETVFYADETIKTIKTDGTVIVKYDDHSVITTTPEGTVIETRTATDAAGNTITNVITTVPLSDDSSRTSHAVNGQIQSVTTTVPDQKTEEKWDSNGNLINKTTIRYSQDGDTTEITQTTYHQDGSTTETVTDNTYHIVNANLSTFSTMAKWEEKQTETGTESNGTVIVKQRWIDLDDNEYVQVTVQHSDGSTTNEVTQVDDGQYPDWWDGNKDK